MVTFSQRALFSAKRITVSDKKDASNLKTKHCRAKVNGPFNYTLVEHLNGMLALQLRCSVSAKRRIALIFANRCARINISRTLLTPVLYLAELRSIAHSTAL